jgi:hypothetical protein
MSEKNDEKILTLKKLVDEKKSKITNVRFVPTTNCLISIDGSNFNLNVLDKDTLILILVKLNMYKKSLEDLKISNFKLSGYSIEDWMTDIKSKLNVLEQKEEANSLKQLEKKLEDLLSTDKKIELEIGDIENLLK